ncbi:unnamed protein product [Owenia fusiformis]|uniref:Histone-lysine N-methyltransferase 2C n=1 Tax=Owenia fusiformis TaxID=6347 RepID=A0A8J1UAB5_OWEFU|nr:unnamed protein product [Owenia fusiformis]
MSSSSRDTTPTQFDDTEAMSTRATRRDGVSPVPKKKSRKPKSKEGTPETSSSDTVELLPQDTESLEDAPSQAEDIMDVCPDDVNTLHSAGSSRASTPGFAPPAPVERLASEDSNQSGEPMFEHSDKICSLCNLGARSLLGQGDIGRYEPTNNFNPFKKQAALKRRSSGENDSDKPDKSPKPLTWRRNRGPLRSNRERSKSPRRPNPHATTDDGRPCAIVDELSVVGFKEDVDIHDLYEESSHTWAHHCCAAWSEGVIQAEDYSLQFVDKAVFAGMSQKCNYCRRFGATILCRYPKCNKKYHYPCASAGGCFQDIKTLSLLCPEHTDQAVSIAGEEANCVVCDLPGDIVEQLFCTSCGQHYHGTCLDPTVETNPVVRAGWQCPECKICQTCRQPGDDNKMLVCDICDKGYHTFCLKPVMTTIPKNGWKCKNCRVCGDCGSRTPGSGPSSRWHLNYTVCDSCYQQRNKGLSCPMCGKAYRQFTQKAMVMCTGCKKHVHSDCDETIDEAVIKKQQTDGIENSDYSCPVCKNGNPMMPMDVEESSNLSSIHSGVIEELDMKEDVEENTLKPDGDSSSVHDDTGQEDILQTSQDSLPVDESSMNMDVDQEKVCLAEGEKSEDGSSPLLPPGPGKGKPMGMGLLKRPSGRPRGSKGKSIGKKNQKRSAAVVAPVERTKRSARTKAPPRTSFSTNTDIAAVVAAIEKAGPPDKVKDEDHLSTVIISRFDDSFVLEQDMCYACGSFGKDEEGELIICSQCGQCYHPYCVSIKLNKVVIKKGWRCLDCTVCEGCGKPHDESKLLLCDDCDISYHIYCLDPPLDTVPKGNWKCKWCANCTMCGSTSPGVGCSWQNHYTKCGPCHSHTICPACRRVYKDEDLIIQCTHCDRWLHALCDGLKNEEEAEIASDMGYQCLYCRSITGHPGPLPPPPPSPEPIPESPPPVPREPEIIRKHIIVDGVVLTESGMGQIRSITVKPPIRRRQKLTPDARKNPQIPTLMGVAPVERVPSIDGSEPPVKDIDDEFKFKESDGEVSPTKKGEFPISEGMVVKAKQKRRTHIGLGIGGFKVKPRYRAGLLGKALPLKPGQATALPIQPTIPEEGEMIEGEIRLPEGQFSPNDPLKKPVRKRRPKRRSQLEDNYPSYLQEAFFGKSTLDNTKSTEDMIASEELEASTGGSQSDKEDSFKQALSSIVKQVAAEKAAERERKKKEEEEAHNLDDGDLKDILPLPGDLELPHDDELMKMIEDEDLQSGEPLDAPTNSQQHREGDSSTDNLDQMLNPTLDLGKNVDMILNEGLANIDTKTMEDLFKGVLTHDSVLSTSPGLGPGSFPLPPVLDTDQQQAPHDSLNLPPHTTPPQAPPLGVLSRQGSFEPGSATPPNGGPLPAMHQSLSEGDMGRIQHPTTLPSFSNMPPPSPYGEVGTSGQFSPGFASPRVGVSEAPWPTTQGTGDDTETEHISYNKRNIMKWEKDEPLGDKATISPVLYANVNHPELKTQYPDWSERSKHIAKIWRKATPDSRAPFLAKARENRASFRLTRAQKLDGGSRRRTKKEPAASTIGATSQGVSVPPPPPPPVGPPRMPPLGLMHGDVGMTPEQLSMAEQKALKEQEQERQWKQLQQMRSQILQERRKEMVVRKDGDPQSTLPNEHQSPQHSQPNTPDGKPGTPLYQSPHRGSQPGTPQPGTPQIPGSPMIPPPPMLPTPRPSDDEKQKQRAVPRHQDPFTQIPPRPSSGPSQPYPLPGPRMADPFSHMLPHNKRPHDSRTPPAAGLTGEAPPHQPPRASSAGSAGVSMQDIRPGTPSNQSPRPGSSDPFSLQRSVSLQEGVQHSPGAHPGHIHPEHPFSTSPRGAGAEYAQSPGTPKTPMDPYGSPVPGNQRPRHPLDPSQQELVRQKYMEQGMNPETSSPLNINDPNLAKTDVEKQHLRELLAKQSLQRQNKKKLEEHERLLRDQPQPGMPPRHWVGERGPSPMFMEGGDVPARPPPGYPGHPVPPPGHRGPPPAQFSPRAHPGEFGPDLRPRGPPGEFGPEFRPRGPPGEFRPEFRPRGPPGEYGAHMVRGERWPEGQMGRPPHPGQMRPEIDPFRQHGPYGELGMRPRFPGEPWHGGRVPFSQHGSFSTGGPPAPVMRHPGQSMADIKSQQSMTAAERQRTPYLHMFTERLRQNQHRMPRPGGPAGSDGNPLDPYDHLVRHQSPHGPHGQSGFPGPYRMPTPPGMTPREGSTESQPGTPQAQPSPHQQPPHSQANEVPPSGGAPRPEGGRKPDEGLEDLLAADGTFNLLEFADPEIQKTLVEDHDKSMFDEHLGLMGEEEQGSQGYPPKASTPKHGIPRPGLSKTGMPKVGAPKAGVSKPGTPTPGTTKPSTPKPTGTTADRTPKQATSAPGTPKQGTSRPATPKSSSSKPGTPKSDSPIPMQTEPPAKEPVSSGHAQSEQDLTEKSVSSPALSNTSTSSRRTSQDSDFQSKFLEFSKKKNADGTPVKLETIPSADVNQPIDSNTEDSNNDGQVKNEPTTPDRKKEATKMVTRSKSPKNISRASTPKNSQDETVPDVSKEETDETTKVEKVDQFDGAGDDKTEENAPSDTKNQSNEDTGQTNEPSEETCLPITDTSQITVEDPSGLGMGSNVILDPRLEDVPPECPTAPPPGNTPEATIAAPSEVKPTGPVSEKSIEKPADKLPQIPVPTALPAVTLPASQVGELPKVHSPAQTEQNTALSHHAQAPFQPVVSMGGMRLSSATTLSQQPSAVSSQLSESQGFVPRSTVQSLTQAAMSMPAQPLAQVALSTAAGYEALPHSEGVTSSEATGPRSTPPMSQLPIYRPPMSTHGGKLPTPPVSSGMPAWPIPHSTSSQRGHTPPSSLGMSSWHTPTSSAVHRVGTPPVSSVQSPQHMSTSGHHVPASMRQSPIAAQHGSPLATDGHHQVSIPSPMSSGVPGMPHAVPIDAHTPPSASELGAVASSAATPPGMPGMGPVVGPRIPRIPSPRGPPMQPGMMPNTPASMAMMSMSQQATRGQRPRHTGPGGPNNTPLEQLTSLSESPMGSPGAGMRAMNPAMFQQQQQRPGMPPTSNWVPGMPPPTAESMIATEHKMPSLTPGREGGHIRVLRHQGQESMQPPGQQWMPGMPPPGMMPPRGVHPGMHPQGMPRGAPFPPGSRPQSMPPRPGMPPRLSMPPFSHPGMAQGNRATMSPTHGPQGTVSMPSPDPNIPRPRMSTSPASSLTRGPSPRPAPSAGTPETPPMSTAEQKEKLALLKDQPLLLEDLLEQERLEQARQAQQQAMLHKQDGSSLLTDADFDKLKVDVMAPDGQIRPQGPPTSSGATPTSVPQTQGSHVATPTMEHPPRMPHPGPIQMPTSREMSPHNFPPGFQRPPGPLPPGVSGGQMSPRVPSPFPASSGVMHPPSHSPAMQSPNLRHPTPPPMPMPPVDGDKQQTQMEHEEWLTNNATRLTMQIKFLEQQLGKQKKSKKQLTAKQRQAKKNGNELSDVDAREIERVNQDISQLNKQLEHFRKQQRAHQQLIQEYRFKQQERYGTQWNNPGSMGPPPSPMMPHSPSTMMPQSPSPMMPQSPSTMMPQSPNPMMPQSSNPMLQSSTPHIVSQSQVSPRIPGSSAPMRMSPSAKQEYDAYMQKRLGMVGGAQGPRGPLPASIIAAFHEEFMQQKMGWPRPGGPPPQGPPPQMMGGSYGMHPNQSDYIDENNPFSENFQERERKHLQQEKQRLQMQQHMDEQRIMQRIEQEGQKQPGEPPIPPQMPFFSNSGPGGPGVPGGPGGDRYRFSPPGSAPPQFSPNSQRFRFPGDPRQPYPGDPRQPYPADARQPYPGDLRQPYPGEPRPQYPGEPRQPYPGEPRQPYPGEPRQPFPGDPRQRQPFPGEQRPPYPGEQRARFPGERFPASRFVHEAAQRFAGDMAQRFRLPGGIGANREGEMYIGGQGPQGPRMPYGMHMTQGQDGGMPQSPVTSGVHGMPPGPGMMPPGMVPPGRITPQTPTSQQGIIENILQKLGSDDDMDGHKFETHKHEKAESKSKPMSSSEKLEASISAVARGEGEIKSPGAREGRSASHDSGIMQSLVEAVRAEIKQEKSDEKTASYDPSITEEQRVSQNMLLKKLLATPKQNDQNNLPASSGSSGSQTTTPSRRFSEEMEENMKKLTPEQQRQLAMIESMPLIRETEVPAEEWEKKTTEEKQKILELREEYEKRRREFEERQQRIIQQQPVKVKKKKKKKVQPPPIPATLPPPATNTPSPADGGPDAKKLKTTDTLDDIIGAVASGEIIPSSPTWEHSSPSSMQELQDLQPEPDGPEPAPDAETVIQAIMTRLKEYPLKVELREPAVHTTQNPYPLTGSGKFTEPTTLRGQYGNARIDHIPDFYHHQPFGPEPLLPPGIIQRGLFGDMNGARRRFLMDGTSSPAPGPESEHQRGVIGEGSSGPLSLRQGLLPDMRQPVCYPSPPLIGPRPASAARSVNSPDTIISSSSPECEFKGEKVKFPGLQVIKQEGEEPDTRPISPLVPIIAPIPIKAEPIIKEENEKELSLEKEIKKEKPDAGYEDFIKEKENIGALVTDGLKSKVSALSSTLSKPLQDAGNQVSVTLTVSEHAAKDIGNVISALADLLKISVPPQYQISRSPSPELFKTGFVKHKEEAINIQSLIKSKPKFCRHCDVLCIAGGGIKKKVSEFPFLSKEDQENDELTFCSVNCCMQFSVTHRSQNADKQKESGDLVEHRSSDEQEKDRDDDHDSDYRPPKGVTSDISISPVSTSTIPSAVSPLTPGVTLTTVQATPTEPNKVPPLIIKVANRSRRRSSSVDSMMSQSKVVTKKWKGKRYKRWDPSMARYEKQVHPPSKKELHELLNNMGMIMHNDNLPKDTRKCILCLEEGDQPTNGPARILNVGTEQWVHLNCLLWSYEVYETISGALMNVEQAHKHSQSVECAACKRKGATVGCFKMRCTNMYHVGCAQKVNCTFFKDKTILCPLHASKLHADEELPNLSVFRRVYVNRDEAKQVAGACFSILHQEEKKYVCRIGSLVFHSVGQLLPSHIQSKRFHTKYYIYPVGFHVTRFYWSFRVLYKRCCYVCKIDDNDGKPEFSIRVIEKGHQDYTVRDSTPKGVWLKLLEPLEKLRKQADLVKLFPNYTSGEEMFGLNEPSILRVIESLPGMDLLKNYHFRYGRNLTVDIPLTINPSGCARSEPKLRTHFKRPYLQSAGTSRSLTTNVTQVTAGDINSPYMKQFVHSKSAQYRKLKTEWRQNVYFGRSRIQGLGLFAARDIEKHTMVIEYIGEQIRNEIAEKREKFYEEQNRGVYMFRMDSDTVNDATMAGGPARYVNHSCNPNCVAEVVPFEKESKIIIIACRKISRGEELSYDYKFDYEDASKKVACLCEAPNCRKWMN